MGLLGPCGSLGGPSWKHLELEDWRAPEAWPGKNGKRRFCPEFSSDEDEGKGYEESMEADDEDDSVEDVEDSEGGQKGNKEDGKHKDERGRSEQ